MEAADSKTKSGYRFPQWDFRSVMILAMLMKGCNLIDAKLNIIPHDTEVRINDSTYFNCSTSLTATNVQWRHGNLYVYTGAAILEPYNDGRFLVEINASTGASNLVIRSVQLSDAGAYECLEDAGFGEKRTAELMVLDGDPVCKSMHLHGVIGPNSCGIEPEEVRLSCSIKYQGNSLPVLQWKASVDNQSISDGRLNITSINNEVTYMLTMKSSLALNNASFICQTTRTSDKHYSCSFSTIQILYVFDSNVTINMAMNDEVSCFANTSQLCRYKWKWFSGDDSITESDDHILKPRKVGWHRCEATCSFGGKSCVVNPFYAIVYSDEAPTRRNRMLFVLLLAPSFAVIGVIMYCWRKKHKERRNVPTDEERLISSYEDATRNTVEIVLQPVKHKHSDGEFGKDWPLTEKELSILNTNHGSLVDLLDLTDLLGRLYSSKVINSRQRESISSKPTSHDKNEKLLDILRSRSLRDYRLTIFCLQQSKQSHIAKILDEGGAVVSVHCNILGEDTKNVTAIENEIVTAIQGLLIGAISDAQIGIVELLNHHIVIAAKTVQRIVLYIYCKTIRNLLKLEQALRSGRFEVSVNSWFNSLLNRSKEISITVMDEYIEEFEKMRTCFKEKTVNTKTIEKFRDFLVERMDPDFGLLGRLFDRDAVGWYKLDIIKSKGSWCERNSELLSDILSEDEGDALIKALRDADQKHIANYVTAKGSRPKDCNGGYLDKRGEDWPLTEMEISILDTNHESLVDLLDLTELLDRLHSLRVINKRQMDSISSKSTSHDKNEQLLDILRRRSLGDYRRTITCLHQSQQNIAAKTFEEGGVVVRVHAKLGEDVKNVNAIENEIVTTIADMLIDMSFDQRSRMLGLLPKVIASKAVQGIVLYIYCKTIAELEQLRESLTLGKLKDSVESWFNSLLKQSHRITVASLIVPYEEFQKMRKYFKETDLKTSDKTLNSLPLELLDVILENSYLHWILNTKPDQRNQYIIRALASVDFCWNRRIAKLRSKKRRWRRLKAVYDETKRKATIIRNNRSFFLENIHLIEKLTLSLNCITKERSHLIQRQRPKRHDSDKLLSVMKSLDETKFSNFVKCLRQNDHKMVARIIENGGGVIKVQVKSRAVKLMDIRKLHQNIEDYRNRTSQWSYQTDKLITELREEDIEILNSQLDRQSVVVWMWCRSEKAVKNLQKLHESNKLRDILFGFANITSSPETKLSFSDIIHAIVINIESNQFKKTVVVSSMSINYIERINDGQVHGLTKLRNEIYVLCGSEIHSLLIRVFEDRNPFRLKRKIERQEIRVSFNDIGSSEKDNCIYVSDFDAKCIWRLTREIEDEYEFVNWITTDFNPSTLSVLRNGNLLLINNRHLVIYGSDAEHIRSIQLPWVLVIPQHVVETSIGTLVVLHRMDKLEPDWPMAMKERDKIVSELTSDGQMVVRRFIPSCEEQTLSDPHYLSLDSDDQVILVQSFKPDGAVILFDSDLIWNRVLSPTKAEEGETKKPRRVYYDEEMKQLIVGGGYEGGTDVYSIIRK